MYSLPPSSLICMRPIRPLPLDGHHPDTCRRPLRGFVLSMLFSIDYQLPDHLYISPRITSIKTPLPVLDRSRVFVMLLHYDILHLQQVAKGIEVTDYRFFVRAIIRHSDLITKVTNRYLVTTINPSVLRHSNLYYQ